MRAALIYPHQLYPDHPALRGADVAVLIEDPLFFQQYRFHSQKLVLHRASMKAYAAGLAAKKKLVWYIESSELSKTSDVIALLVKQGVQSVQWVDPCDQWLEQRLKDGCRLAKLPLTTLEDPHFLTPWSEFDSLGREKKGWFFTAFYVAQRKRLELLLDDRGKPLGGKWSFDRDNRAKLPRQLAIPQVTIPASSDHLREAQQYVARQFPSALGSSDGFHYPITRQQALAWLDQFIEQRLELFGLYEDAISPDHDLLFHSALTAPLNIGLISPLEVVQRAIDAADRVPLNSLEGFVRQVIGWREFVRGVYRTFSVQQRTTNYWNHQRPLPDAFYQANTGIEPVDTVIRRVLRGAYCHHIERLMIAGNFMLLCEIDPDHVYRWFMELFIDAYDWVMVPNVYGMSQYADGGLMTTKPYISGSSYVLRMSGFRKGDWSPIWDGLYWRFVDKHRDFFAANPRMSVMVSQLDRMGSKLKVHRSVAEQFLENLR